MPVRSPMPSTFFSVGSACTAFHKACAPAVAADGLFATCWPLTETAFVASLSSFGPFDGDDRPRINFLQSIETGQRVRYLRHFVLVRVRDDKVFLDTSTAKLLQRAHIA